MSDAPLLIHIVDDNPSVCRALKRLLHSWEMQARTFATGEESLSALSRSEDLDCAVIDVQMPGLIRIALQRRRKPFVGEMRH